MMQLDYIKEDYDVAKPFFDRLLQRAKEKHPNKDIRMEDISVKVIVNILNPISEIYRMLDDIRKEGISF